MEIFSDIEEFNKSGAGSSGTAIAIGKFDGVHPGHMKLLEEIIGAKERELASLVFTFDRPIADFFTGEDSPVITTLDEKIKLFQDAGVDILYVMPVKHDTVSQDPEAFVRDVLVSGLKGRMIAAGSDLSFGDKGKGNMELLRSLSGELAIDVREIEKVRYEGEEISSTLIRDAVTDGKMERAAGLLGRPYSIESEVICGKMLGRTIGMPTANMEYPKGKIVPPKGVYYSKVHLKDGVKCGITNIGEKPTVSSDGVISAETYIYDHDRDIYGEVIRIDLLKFVRGEMRFDSIEKLKKQMHDDSIKGLTFFRETER